MRPLPRGVYHWWLAVHPPPSPCDGVVVVNLDGRRANLAGMRERIVTLGTVLFLCCLHPSWPCLPSL